MMIPLMLAMSDAAAHGSFVAQWKLDESTGSTATADPTTHNGALTNFPGDDSQWITGQAGNGLAIDGVDDYVDISNHADLNFGTGDFSISLWFKTSQATGVNVWPEMIYKGDTNERYEVFMGDSSYAGDVFFKIWVGGATAGVNYGGMNDDTWHHLVGTKTSSELQLFIDNALVDSVSHSLTATIDNTQPLYFGSVAADSWSLYDGALDDIQFYDHKLSAAQVDYLFDNPGTAIPLPMPLGMILAALTCTLVRIRRQGSRPTPFI